MKISTSAGFQPQDRSGDVVGPSGSFRPGAGRLNEGLRQLFGRVSGSGGKFQLFQDPAGPVHQ